MNRQQRRALGIKPTETALIPRRKFTEQQVALAHDLGAAAALKEYAKTGDAMYKASMALALHDLHKFGKSRIEAVFDRMAAFIAEAKNSDELVERCKRETGVTP